MATATAELSILSVGDIAERFGVAEYLVRKVLDRIGLGKRLGRYRVVASGDLDTVEVALRAAGYLDPPATGARAGAVEPDPEMAQAARGFHPSDGPHGLARFAPDQPHRHPEQEGATSHGLCDEG